MKLTDADWLGRIERDPKLLRLPLVPVGRQTRDRPRRGRLESDARYSISKTASTSTAAPVGREKNPSAERA